MYVCYEFTYRVRHLTFFFQLVLVSWCLIWQIIRFVLPPNEYCCVYAWAILESRSAIDLQKLTILAKKFNFSDEARFDLGVYVNKQNCRIWSTEIPHAYIEKPTHSTRVTVWCGFWTRCIIGLFLCENEHGEAVTVNGNRYRAMLNEFLFTKIEEEDVGNICWSYTRCFAPCFWRSHYQSQSWCPLATSELRLDTAGLLFVCRTL